MSQKGTIGGMGQAPAAQEYKNHGQMVSAAAHQGIKGKELSQIARREVTLEELIAQRDGQIRQAEAGQQQPAEAAAQGIPALTPLDALAADAQSMDAVAAEFFRQNSIHFRNLGAI